MTPTQLWDRKTSLLAIDPGARTGWALFLEVGGWHLAASGVVSPTEPPTWPGLSKIDQVVIENPVIYPHSKARPKDILTLARTVGRYQERFDRHPIELVEPRTWKGSVDGDIMVRRIEAALTPRDLAAYGKATCRSSEKHNMTDAVGIGQWALKQPFMRSPRFR